MKFSIAVFPIVLGCLGHVQAIRLIKGVEALDVFGVHVSQPVSSNGAIDPFPHTAKAKDHDISDWITSHGAASGVAPHVPHAKPSSSSSGWLTAIYALGTPRTSEYVGSDNPDEDAIIEAMLDRIAQPSHAHGEQGSDEGLPLRGHHDRHGQGRTRGAFHTPDGLASCFGGRLFNALSSLRPAEAGFLAFTIGAGLGSLFRIVFMFILLAKRSHAYMNEGVSAMDSSVEGYPGAVFRARGAEADEAHDPLLPAYTPTAGFHEKEVVALST